MKTTYFIPIVALLGLTTLFFFPEPESNFFAYAGTALFFAVVIAILILLEKKHKPT